MQTECGNMRELYGYKYLHLLHTADGPHRSAEPVPASWSLVDLTIRSSYILELLCPV